MGHARNENTRAQIKGLIIPEQWDQEGKVVGITIQTDREEIYFVAPNETGRDLLSFVHEEVEADGEITKRLNGTAMITVDNFRTVKSDVAQTAVCSK